MVTHWEHWHFFLSNGVLPLPWRWWMYTLPGEINIHIHPNSLRAIGVEGEAVLRASFPRALKAWELWCWPQMHKPIFFWMPVCKAAHLRHSDSCALSKSSTSLTVLNHWNTHWEGRRKTSLLKACFLALSRLQKYRHVYMCGPCSELRTVLTVLWKVCKTACNLTNASGRSLSIHQENWDPAEMHKVSSFWIWSAAILPRWMLYPYTIMVGKSD